MPDILPTAVEGGVLRAREGQWVPEDVSAGIAGPPGDPGLPGADGAQGLPGADGADGAAGGQGIQGVPGNDGAQGIQGIQGEPGADANVTAHEAAGNPHPGYLTPTEGDAAYDATGAAAAAVATHEGGAPHAGLATDAEVAAAVVAHAGEANPHPTYETAAEVLAQIADHEAAADPHTGYQKESEKGSANGYAGLGAGGLVPIAQLASGTPNGLKFIRDDGTLVTPGGGDDARLVLKRLASQHDSSATTPAKVTELDQTLGVGSWVVEYFIRWRTSLAATGVKFGLNHSGTVTSFVWNQRQFDISAAASTAVPDQDNVQAAGAVMMGFSSRAKGTAGRGVLLSADTVNLDMLTIIEALVEVTVSGDIQLYFGSEATGSIQSVMVGSVLRATKAA